MRVLVVGGSGLVGGLTIPSLQEHHEIRVFDRRAPAFDIGHVVGDLHDVGALRTAVAGMEAVVFMAMGAKVDFGTLDTDLSQFDVSVSGLFATLAAAHEAGISRFVYASSMSVYAIEGRGPYPSEEVPPNAVEPYGLAKRFGEELCRIAAEKRGMRVVALRLCFPTPAEDWPPRNSHPHRPTIATSGRDTARAFVAALEHDEPGFHPYTISGDTQNRLVDISRAQARLGWSPLDPTP